MEEGVTGQFNLGGVGEFSDLASQVCKQHELAGALVFIVRNDTPPMTARISSYLSVRAMLQMPTILRQAAKMMEEQLEQLHAAPPPGTTLS